MARKGPGKDYPALWVYHVDGLPVQVVAETEEWRRICGPDGGAAWVNRSEIDGRRTLLNQSATATPIYQAPKDGAKEIGLLNSMALARVRKCQPGWCQIRAGGLQGWMTVDQVWGVAEARQCR
jgi:SH3-like domain-containing protein